MLRRRQFLKLVGGSAALASSGVISNPAARIVMAAQVPGRVFVKATIQGVDQDKIFATSRNAPVTFQLTPTSDIWKGQHGLGAAALKPGDFLYVDGWVNFDGSVAVRQLHANIVNYYGRLIRAIGGQFELIPYMPTPLSWTVQGLLSTQNPATIINNGLGTANDLRIDRFAQVVGVRQGDGRVLATRIWV
jgi:hypothetical protein